MTNVNFPSPLGVIFPLINMLKELMKKGLKWISVSSRSYIPSYGNIIKLQGTADKVDFRLLSELYSFLF